MVRFGYTMSSELTPDSAAGGGNRRPGRSRQSGRGYCVASRRRPRVRRTSPIETMANPNASGTHSARPVNGSSADLTCGAAGGVNGAEVDSVPAAPPVGFAPVGVNGAFGFAGGVNGAYCA